MTTASETVRKMFGEGDRKRDAGLKTPADIIRYDDIQYGDIEPKWQMLDVYRPKNAEGKLPVIVSVHGGAWVYGDKDVYQFYCMSLAQRGFAVVNFSYRLSPEYKYPASFEDTSSVCAWILENAEKYGFDTDKIFGVGDSAGAHMLSLFSCALTNPEYAAVCGYQIPDGFRFQAIALNCGAFKMEMGPEGELNAQLMKGLLPKGGTDEEFELISSYLHITPDYPPVYIMTCPGDFLKAQPAFIIPVLEENDVQFVYHRFGDKKNPLAHVFHCNIRSAEGNICNDEECAFFREFI